MSRLLESVRRRRAADRAPARLVDRALRVADEAVWAGGQPAVRRLDEVQAILTASDDVRLECVRRLASIATDGDAWPARELLQVVARKRLPLTPDDVEWFLRLFVEASARGRRGAEGWWATQILTAVVAQIEHAFTSSSEEDRARLAPLVETAAKATDDAKATRRLLRLVEQPSDGLPLELVDGDDDVGPRIRAVFEASDEDRSLLARTLVLLAGYPQSGKASKRWLAEADALASDLADARALAAALVDAALAAEDTTSTHEWEGEEYEHTRFLIGGNDALLCGAVVFAGRLRDESLLPALRRLAAKSVAVIGGEFGSPRSLRLANACAHAVAEADSAASITELLALERAVRHGSLLREIRKAIEALAERQGVTPGELLERAVERHGLEPDGTRTVRLSQGHALLAVEGASVRVLYVDGSGARRKTFPDAVKDADGKTLAGLREDVKAVRKTVANERRRLDSLLVENRTWPLERWRALYLDHPITGRLTRACIWTFRGEGGADVTGIPVDAETTALSDGTTGSIPDGSEVRLWHPIAAAPSDVAAWRTYLLEHELVQPVKQAFRELYVVAPAEEETELYSNRFAGHVFQQVRARALMKGRGWAPVAVAWWDDGIDHGVARRVFEPRVRAEFFFDPIVDVEPQASDLYPYCTSDQVRFFDETTDEVIPVRDVPPLVFSEAMRDVDLFVTVTSIGADPEWLDRGEGRRFRTYWHEFSFGRLSAAAKIRREVLDQLVPRLAIADRLELQERYLVVRGDLRTYRIHLGSSNVLMSPNDQYLCIVAARGSRARKLFLPFDDDPVLSVILSKAFMLADDTSIADPTIAKQIRP